MVKKDFLITKISDQKDGYKDGYQYYRTLEVNEEGLPTEEELLNLLTLEQNKNVTFFIGEEKISIISYISDFRYKRNTLKEYKNWNQEELKQVKARTFYKHFEYLNEVIPNLEEVRTKQNETYKTR